MTSVENLSELTDEQLRNVLLEFGVSPGPIVATTRRVYEMKLKGMLSERSCENDALNVSGTGEKESTKQNGGSATLKVIPTLRADDSPYEPPSEDRPRRRTVDSSSKAAAHHDATPLNTSSGSFLSASARHDLYSTPVFGARGQNELISPPSTANSYSSTISQRTARPVDIYGNGKGVGSFGAGGLGGGSYDHISNIAATKNGVKHQQKQTDVENMFPKWVVCILVFLLGVFVYHFTKHALNKLSTPSMEQ